MLYDESERRAATYGLSLIHILLFSTHITSDIEKCADDILYIRDGKLVANCSMDDFRKNCCGDGESLEDAILRMERGVRA